VNGTPSFPDAMAFGAAGVRTAPRSMERSSQKKHERSESTGILPVADVNSNPITQSSTHALLEKILLWWQTGVGLHQRRSGTWDAYHSEALSWTR